MIEIGARWGGEAGKVRCSAQGKRTIRERQISLKLIHGNGSLLGLPSQATVYAAASSCPRSTIHCASRDKWNVVIFPTFNGPIRIRQSYDLRGIGSANQWLPDRFVAQPIWKANSKNSHREGWLHLERSPSQATGRIFEAHLGISLHNRRMSFAVIWTEMIMTKA